MAKNNDYLGMLLATVAFMVSLAVGFGMVGGTLVVPYIPAVASEWSGWIVVGTTLVGAVMSLMKKFG